MSSPEEILAQAVSDAVAPVAHLETQLEPARLEKKIRDHFKKAAKNLHFSTKSWMDLVHDFAHAAMQAVFASLGDRYWLTQVDFVLCLDAAVKTHFPPQLLESVPQEDFEAAVLVAHDAAFEEQRFDVILWEVIGDVVTDDAVNKKRVFNSFDVRARDAALRAAGREEKIDKIKTFIARWVDGAISKLSRMTGKHPETVMPEDVALRFFESLIEAGALPICLVSECGPPPHGWPFLGYIVHMAYVAHSRMAIESSQDSPRSPRGKGLGKGKSSLDELTSRCPPSSVQLLQPLPAKRPEQDEPVSCSLADSALEALQAVPKKKPRGPMGGPKPPPMPPTQHELQQALQHNSSRAQGADPNAEAQS